jgi:aminobenzoyl-glutamate utilization protein B
MCFSLLCNWAYADWQKVNELANQQRERSAAIADELWELAELGYLEIKSSNALQNYLRDNEFSVVDQVADIPTAFVATYGSGEPTIAILAEFDALPGLNQAPSPVRKITKEGAAGHACGHHLFGAASTSAAVTLAKWLQETGSQGTIKLVGTPAEEGGSGKVYLARAGVFDDVDVVLHWHPGDSNSASPSSSTANKSGRFTFTGQAAHAASAPHRGRSALDGVEAMNFMVNLMREHVPQLSRIHYVITDGGDAPNIVPERAQVYYYVRHPDKGEVLNLFERVSDAAKAAALGTQTQVDIEVMHGNYPILPNYELSRLVYNNFLQIGGISYNAEEQAFAEEMRKSLPGARKSLGSQSQIAPFEYRQGMGSTDVGDVSWLVPTVGFRAATWVPGTPSHSWQAVAAGATTIGHKGMFLATKLLSKTAVDLLQNPSIIEAAKQELRRSQGQNFNYSALLGDREPPLNYRR